MSGLRSVVESGTFARYGTRPTTKRRLTRDGEVWCWGDNGAGQLGDGTTVTRNVAVRVERLPAATMIASGSFFTCAVAQDGRVLCWGSNVNGALGGEDRRQQRALDPQEVKW